MALIERRGGVTDVPSTQGSIYAAFTDAEGQRFYPLHLRAEGGATVSFTLRYLHQRSRLRDEKVRLQLLEALAEIVGPLTTMNLKGRPCFKVERLTAPATLAKFEDWLANVLNHMK
jgi:hypothetical protein